MVVYESVLVLVDAASIVTALVCSSSPLSAMSAAVRARLANERVLREKIGPDSALLLGALWTSTIHPSLF